MTPPPLLSSSSSSSNNNINNINNSDSNSSNSINPSKKCNNNKNQNRHISLINPSAAPYVALTPSSNSTTTPATLLPSNHQLSSASPSSSASSYSHSPSPLRSSQHSLKPLLQGGRYYDEYDEDDVSAEFALQSASSPSITTASFPPPSTAPPSNKHRPPLRLQFQSTKSFVIDLTPPSASTTTTSHPQPLLNSLAASSSSSSSSTPLSPPSTCFNYFSYHWNSIAQDKPLLSLLLRLGLLLLGSALVLASLIWVLLPPVADEHRSDLRIPTSFEALKKLNLLLQVYKNTNYYRVLSSFILIYLFLQAFSLPGSMYLSILAGAMYGVSLALPLVCLCVGTGALLCYVMSANLGATVFLYSPSLRTRLEAWKIKLGTKTNKFDLLAYLVVIRISPLPPHWVVNLLAPHVGIEIGLFWLSTCCGILPITLIHTQLGTTLDQMVGPEDLSFFNTKNLSGLALVAFAVLVPVGIRWHFKKDLEDPIPAPGPNTSTRRRIELCLGDEDDTLSNTRPIRRLRSLSAQSYDPAASTPVILTATSSVSSLAALNTSPSSETLSSLVGRRTSPQLENLNHPSLQAGDDDFADCDHLGIKQGQLRRTALPLHGTKAARILGLSPHNTAPTSTNLASDVRHYQHQPPYQTQQQQQQYQQQKTIDDHLRSVISSRRNR